ncbi:MAG: hypothetical protein ACFFHD_01110 [Promethearchaeota archaeon]
MIFEWNFTENFLEPLAKFAAFIILVLGVIWIIFALYEAKRRGGFKKRKTEDYDLKVTKFLKGLTYLGFIVGIFGILSGVGGLILDIKPSVAFIGDGRSIFTSIFLIVIGVFTFLKPLNDLPIASVVGILAASAVGIIVSSVIPDVLVQHIAIHIDPKLFFIVLFIIVFAIVAILVKFYIGGLMTASKIISWPPFAFIVAALCLIQGFLLLVVGISITGLF